MEVTSESDSDAFGPAPSAPPPSARDALKARVIAASLGRPAPSEMLLAGRYRLGREIGRGGVGAVWEGVLEPLGRPVAIKFLRTSSFERDRGASERMLREARVLASLDHPQIVKVFDVGADVDGRPFIVMERLHGRALGEVLAEKGGLGPEAAIEIGLQVCLALQEAHRIGLVHRDIKPANLFVVHEGSPWRCKLLDFGLSKQLEPTAVDGLTGSRAILGTPGYLAPEQACGDRIDRRADIYGLACVLFEILVGRPLFSDDRAAVMLASQLRGRSLGGEVEQGLMSAAWADLLERALQVEPDARPSDAGAMADALRAVARRSTVPRPRGARAYLGVSSGLIAVAILSAIGIARVDAPSSASIRSSLGHPLNVPIHASFSRMVGLLRLDEGRRSSGRVQALREDLLVAEPRTEFDGPSERGEGPPAADATERVRTPSSRAALRRARVHRRADVSAVESDADLGERREGAAPKPTEARTRRVLAPGIRDPFELAPDPS